MSFLFLKKQKFISNCHEHEFFLWLHLYPFNKTHSYLFSYMTLTNKLKFNRFKNLKGLKLTILTNMPRQNHQWTLPRGKAQPLWTWHRGRAQPLLLTLREEQSLRGLTLRKESGHHELIPKGKLSFQNSTTFWTLLLLHI